MKKILSPLLCSLVMALPAYAGAEEEVPLEKEALPAETASPAKEVPSLLQVTTEESVARCKQSPPPGIAEAQQEKLCTCFGHNFAPLKLMLQSAGVPAVQMVSYRQDVMGACLRELQ